MSLTSTERDYTLEDVAEVMGMSTRWVRQQIKDRKPAHQRYGNRISFTADQLATFRAMFTTQPVPQSVTTGRKKAS